VEPREAATVMLVRDAPNGGPHDGDFHAKPPATERAVDDPGSAPRSATGLEVFLLRRNLHSAFVAGAYVFPGGALDPEDRAPEMLDLVHGYEASVADGQLGVDGGLGFWVAAIRESFEEGGVLLARDRATGCPVDPRVSNRLAPERSAIASREASFAELLASEGLVLDAGRLRPFGRWITPSPAPRRYDTWFFVAPAPAGHAYAHDANETVASEWMRPTDALARAGRQEIELIYPTFRSLQALARFHDTASLFAAVDRAWQEPTTALRVMKPDQGWQVRLTGDDDDSEVDALAHSTTHRRAAGAR